MISAQICLRVGLYYTINIRAIKEYIGEKNNLIIVYGVIECMVCCCRGCS